MYNYIRNKTWYSVDNEIFSETVVDPSLRLCCWWRVSRWRYCDAIMYCDVILTNCPRSVLRSKRAFFCRRQVDYHSLIIDSDSWRYHQLAYKDYVLWHFNFFLHISHAWQNIEKCMLYINVLHIIWILILVTDRRMIYLSPTNRLSIGVANPSNCYI